MRSDGIGGVAKNFVHVLVPHYMYFSCIKSQLFPPPLPDAHWLNSHECDGYRVVTLVHTWYTHGYNLVMFKHLYILLEKEKGNF